MCGIAGIIDLAGQRPAPAGVVQRMARALVHRGPDEEGFFERPGLALASRRLSIVGLADGQQPMTNEDRSVFVVFNGELFDHVERRAELERDGPSPRHTLRYRDHSAPVGGASRRHVGAAARTICHRTCGMSDSDELHLGRDRFGIAPLFWSRQGDWLLFASEIKGLLASGMVPASDPIGAASITSSLSPRCPGRGPVSRACSFCRRAISCASCPGGRATEPGHRGTRVLGNEFPGRRATRMQGDDSKSVGR